MKIVLYIGIPQHIIEKQSSARLWKGQTAENEIRISYEIIDKILNQINFDKVLKNSLIPEKKGVDQKDIRTVIERIKNNRHIHELPIPRCKLNIKYNRFIFSFKTFSLFWENIKKHPD